MPRPLATLARLLSAVFHHPGAGVPQRPQDSRLDERSPTSTPSRRNRSGIHPSAHPAAVTPAEPWMPKPVRHDGSAKSRRNPQLPQHSRTDATFPGPLPSRRTRSGIHPSAHPTAAAPAKPWISDPVRHDRSAKSRHNPQLPQHSRPLALLLAAFIAASPATARDRLTWPDLTSRTRPTPDATLSYGRDPSQKVDLWLPATRARGKTPVVVMVHGGCWTTAIADRSLMNWIADDLRRSGVAVWNIDYRGVDRPGGGYPGTFADAAAATDLLAREAPRYRLDLTRVIATGHSAGGHLALWLAARPRLPAASPLRTPHPLRIAHVVSLGGLPDLEETAAATDNGCGTEVIGKLVGTRRADPYADTSVPRLLPLGLPQDLVNGREDRIIPWRLATGYVAKARAAGDRATLHPVADTGHVELIAPETPAWAEAKRLVLAAIPPRTGATR